MAKITNEEITNKLNARFEGQLTITGEPFGLLTLETGRENIIDILDYLKNDTELQFIYLTDITGIHYPEQEKQIGVIYHLHNLRDNVRVRVKVFLPNGDEHIPTASS